MNRKHRRILLNRARQLYDEGIQTGQTNFTLIEKVLAPLRKELWGEIDDSARHAIPEVEEQ